MIGAVNNKEFLGYMVKKGSFKWEYYLHFLNEIYYTLHWKEKMNMSKVVFIFD